MYLRVYWQSTGEIRVDFQVEQFSGEQYSQTHFITEAKRK